jgi:putative hydrolase of the HAD superfamily
VSRVEVGAILFDMGGVLTTSPFDNFADYETRAGLPAHFIRLVNSTDSDTNAWSRLERGELDAAGFIAAFEAEAVGLGQDVDGAAVLACLEVELRPAVIDAVREVQQQGTATALLTNNSEPLDIAALPTHAHDVFDSFDTIVQSCLVGSRKPDPRFYQIACERLGVAPSRCLFLDDLGVNLKSARAMGMATVKVTTGDDVVDALRPFFEIGSFRPTYGQK